MKAMIFAAGLGTRLRPLTDSMPKALVPVSGKPLLRHVLDRLQEYGYDDITVNVHHFGDMIEHYLSFADGISDEPGKGIHISDERDRLLDTGGGIFHARKFLEGSGSFLIHNVDILSDLDLGHFARAVRPEDLATLVVSPRTSSRYLLFDDDLRLVGWTNVKTGEVKSPLGRIDVDKYHRYAFSGIHVMSDMVFEVMEKEEAHDGPFPVMDFYLKVAADYPVRAYVARDLRVVDVGKLDTLALAQTFWGDPVE